MSDTALDPDRSGLPGSPPPWQAGLEAARANLIPGAVLSLFAIGLLLSYWYVPAVQSGLDRLGGFKQAAGWPYVVVSTAVFGGMIPGLVQRLRPALRHTMPWKFFGFTLVFWAYKGLEVDLLYRLQAAWFGHGSDLSTLAIKIFIDMAVYCPIWAVPSTVLAYAWAERGFSWSRTLAPLREIGLRGWFGRDILPVVISNWAVWVPAVCVIYCLPLALQLLVQNLVLCFWSLLLVLQVGPKR